MTTNTFSAAANPALANKIVNEALTVIPQEVEGEATTIVIPSLPETTVELPAGLYDSFDETLLTTAEVRELTGADEEAIVKINEPGKALFAILERGTVSVGDKKATKAVLDSLLAGDREALLLAIRVATFGPDIDVEAVCSRCPEVQTFKINLTKDVEMKTLDDRATGRYFALNLKVGEVLVQLPTGETQNKLINSSNKNSAELDTILLTNCVTDIGGKPVLSEASVRALGIKDRREILEEIAKRNPGPQLSEIKKACGNCGQEVDLPLTLAELFQS